MIIHLKNSILNSNMKNFKKNKKQSYIYIIIYHQNILKIRSLKRKISK